MKRFISLIIVGCFGLMMAQDAAGTYKLTGTNVRYTSLLRQTSTVSATDAYGIGVTIPLATFPINAPAGQLINGPFNEDNLELSGAFLNVTFNEDGSGTVNEGSYYPTLDLDEETCLTSGAALPITDELVYTSNLTPAQYVQTTTLLGIPSLSPFSGQFIGGISLSQSAELDLFTFGQSAGALGACGAGFYADGTPCDASVPGNDCAIYEACASAGYVSKGHDIETVEGNGVRDMYVEWHAIDGSLSQSGFGDDASDPCEDGLCVANADLAECQEADGSVSPACTAELEAFDRILGVPGLPSTVMNPDCGYGEFIVGGSDLVGPALAGGVLATCTAGVQTDLDENGFADVVDACFGIEMGYGLPGDQAATMAFMGACAQLGFSEEDCALLAAGAAGAVTGQFACYDPVSHNLTVPNDDGTCNEGALLELEWNCYGLAALTVDPWTESVCGLAAAAWLGDCVLGDGLSSTFGVLDATLAPWGGFLTWNSVSYSQCLAGGGGDACNAYLVADGGYAFDPACLADGDPSDCSGRLLMNMDPTCVPELQVREVYIDFDQIDDSCGTGDLTLDGIVNILDVVNLVQLILGGGEATADELCGGDLSGDGLLSILDVVALIQNILGGRTDNASMIEIFNNNNTVTIEADGYVGAVQMTLNHGSNFSIELTNDAFVAQSHTDGNQTKLMVVNPGSELFTAEGQFEIVEVIAANSNDYIDVVNPDAISLSDAYPNPFNPTTSFELQVGTAGHVTMNVYNLMGQNVGTLVNNTMDAGNYNITWDATNFSSGMYIVKAETVNGIASQKVMLVK
jgi:hypothetical protein